jgi:hypothetical protein
MTILELLAGKNESLLWPDVIVRKSATILKWFTSEDEEFLGEGCDLSLSCLLAEMRCHCD